MGQLFKQLTSYTKKLRQNMSDLFNKESSTRVEVEDLVSIIATNKNSHHSQDTLLGLVFNTYTLTFDTFQCKVETKGMNNEQFLEFTVQSFGEKVFSYKGYEHPQRHSIRLPETVYKQLIN